MPLLALLCKKSLLSKGAGPHCRCTSPQYVDAQLTGSPTGSYVDAGVPVTFALTNHNVRAGATQTSFFLVLNAKDLTEVARAPIPVAVPFGFHGQFYSRDGTFTTET